MELKLQFNQYDSVWFTNNSPCDYEHADICMIIGNKNDERSYMAALQLKEHEARYLANAILNFVDNCKAENERAKKEEQ